MKGFTIMIILLSFLVNVTAVGAQSPTQVVQQLITEVSRQHSVAPVVEHLDWQGVFNSMDPAMKEQMGYKSVEDLKKHEVDAYSHSGEQIRESIDRALRTSPPRQKAILEATKEHLDASLQRQKAEADKAFAHTRLSVGKAKMGRDTAQVELIKERDGQITTETLELVSVDGKWKLKSAAAFNPINSGGPSHAESVLGNSIASPDEALARPF